LGHYQAKRTTWKSVTIGYYCHKIFLDSPYTQKVSEIRGGNRLLIIVD